ncbi:hypothetical protein E4T39_06266 [Aureobasidium subglaciale]|nr:hypothetical protein E4T39_06266 [Aureobasidium subglaciale]
MAETQPLLHSALKHKTDERAATRMSKQVAFMPTSKEVCGDLAGKDKSRSLDSVSHVACHHVYSSPDSGDSKTSFKRAQSSPFPENQDQESTDQRSLFRDSSQVSRSHFRSASNSAVCGSEFTFKSCSALSSPDMQAHRDCVIDCDFENLSINIEMSAAAQDSISILEKMANDCSVSSYDSIAMQDSSLASTDTLSEVATAGHKRRLISRRHQRSISPNSDTLSTTAVCGSPRPVTHKDARPRRLQPPPSIMDREPTVKSSKVCGAQVCHIATPFAAFSSPHVDQNAHDSMQEKSCLSTCTCEDVFTPGQKMNGDRFGLSPSDNDGLEFDACVGGLSSLEKKYLSKEDKEAVLLGCCYGLSTKPSSAHGNTDNHHQLPKSSGRRPRKFRAPCDRPLRFISPVPTPLNPEGQLGQARNVPRLFHRRVAAQHKSSSRLPQALTELPMLKRHEREGLSRRKVQSHPVTAEEIQAVKAAHLPDSLRQRSTDYHYPAAWQPARKSKNNNKKQSHNDQNEHNAIEDMIQEKNLASKGVSRKTTQKSWFPSLF